MKWYTIVLKKYAVFTGRASRSEFWYFTLFSFLISIVLSVIDLSIRQDVFSNIYSLAVLVPTIAVSIRRMHDVNKSGWFILIPIYNIILFFTKGDEGTNEYGRDPKRPEFEDEIDMIGSDLA